jgi:hypothetical protein
MDQNAGFYKRTRSRIPGAEHRTVVVGYRLLDDTCCSCKHVKNWQYLALMLKQMLRAFTKDGEPTILNEHDLEGSET